MKILTTMYGHEFHSVPNTTLVTIIAMSKKLGRSDGSFCQHAFIMLLTLSGYGSGRANLVPVQTLAITSWLVMPLYGVSDGLYISQMTTPKLHTSVAGENSLLKKLSGAIHRTGTEDILVVAMYLLTSFGSSLSSPKSPTLQISSALTMTLRAARSYLFTITISNFNEIYKLETYTMYKALFRNVMHPSGYIQHVFDQVFDWFLIFLHKVKRL